jgi:hypothetical protein
MRPIGSIPRMSPFCPFSIVFGTFAIASRRKPRPYLAIPSSLGLQPAFLSGRGGIIGLDYVHGSVLHYVVDRTPALFGETLPQAMSSAVSGYPDCLSPSSSPMKRPKGR